MSRPPLMPGSILGVLGGGQLGRMFAMAAARLGYRVHVFDPDPDAPAAQVAAAHTVAAYADLAAIDSFGRKVDAVTYEFENVPAASAVALHKLRPVCPSPDILATTRNRLSEKHYLQQHHVPVTPFAAADSPNALRAQAQALGGRVIVKTTELGYDGKGQATFSVSDDASALWSALGDPAEVIVEQRINLKSECSVLVARDQYGNTVVYGPFDNTHANHILDVTTWTASPAPETTRAAQDIGVKVADAFLLEGLLCVECFIDQQNNMMVNEIAPRPHNSGHLTIEAHSISQFEQQVRLTAGQQAIKPVPRAPAAAMVNLLGDLWTNGEPHWQAVWAEPGVALHLYGKKTARPGRKMGHLTALAETPEKAATKLLTVRSALLRST